jgi:hypothetical protein
MRWEVSMIEIYEEVFELIDLILEKYGVDVDGE